MTSIIKVDQIQTVAGATPTIAMVGINDTGTVLQVVNYALPVGSVQYTNNDLNWTSVTSSDTTATSKAVNSKWVVTFTGIAACRDARPLSFDIWYSVDGGSTWNDMSGNRDSSNHSGSGSGLGLTGYWQSGGTDDWFPLSMTVGGVISVVAGTSIKFRVAMRNGGPSSDIANTNNCIGHGDYTMQMTVMEIAG
tara:strand:+ start:902 stop:1480 length:579 start_codon:yes stop_codon:yes gene_type:complete